MTSAKYLARWEVEDVSGAVVVIDVIRAFTTAAYAFGAGARQIRLVGTVDEALAVKRAERGIVAIGEEHGRRPPGFDLSNSPVAVAAANLSGRTLVQRTSAGTQGVLAARSATRLWCASLVCATATARAVGEADLGAPVYVITGRFPDASDSSGADDLLAAQYIEDLRSGRRPDRAATAGAVAATEEASRTLALGGGDSHPDDIAYSVDIDRFDFAMEVHREGDALWLRSS